MQQNKTNNSPLEITPNNTYLLGDLVLTRILEEAHWTMFRESSTTGNIDPVVLTIKTPNRTVFDDLAEQLGQAGDTYYYNSCDKVFGINPDWKIVEWEKLKIYVDPNDENVVFVRKTPGLRTAHYIALVSPREKSDTEDKHIFVSVEDMKGSWFYTARLECVGEKPSLFDSIEKLVIEQELVDITGMKKDALVLFIKKQLHSILPW